MRNRAEAPNDSNTLLSTLPDSTLPDSAWLENSRRDSAISTERTAKTASIAKRFGIIKRITAVVALTLMLSAVLLSTTASPASARPRDLANAAIDECFGSGGNPDAFYFGSTIIVTCVFYDGSWWWADFG